MAGLLQRPPRGCEFSKLLPYSESIKDETQEAFQHILHNLDEAISKRDIRAVAVVLKWLSGFIELYQCSFSIADQVHLIHVMFSLLSSETTRKGAFNILVVLLDEKYLLPDDLEAAGLTLELPWRVLHDIMHEEMFSKFSAAIKRTPSKTLTKAATLASRYFAPSATQEITSLLMPKICPFTHNQEEEFILTNLLPTHRHSAAASGPGFLAWLPDMLEIQDWGGNNAQTLSLVTRAAYNNIGHLSLEQYYSRLFSGVLWLLNVPVGAASDNRSSRSHADSESLMYTAAKLVVAMINPDGQALDHLASLLKSIASFFHPSNSGEWTERTCNFVYHLCYVYPRRMYSEQDGTLKVPDTHKLTVALNERFVSILIDPLIYLLHSKRTAVISRAIAAHREMMFLAPTIMAPPLLENITSTLETAVDVQQIVSVLSAACSISTPLFDPTHYPDGMQHFTTLFTLTLPHIDINDPRKALSSLSLMVALTSLVPLVDCSSASPPPNLSENLTKAWENTQYVEDLVLQSVDRVLEMLEVPLNHAYLDGAVGALIRKLFLAIRTHSSQSAQELVWVKIRTWLNDHTEPSSIKAVSYLCLLFVGNNPTRAIPFVQELCHKVIAEVSGQPTVTDAHADENHTPGHAVWYLGLLNAVVKRTAYMLLPSAPLIIEMLEKTLFLASKAVTKHAGKVLRHLLRSLTEYPLAVEQGEVTPETFVAYLSKGPLVPITDFKFSPLHQPTLEDKEFAESLLVHFYNPALEYVRTVVNGSNAQWGTLLEVNKRLVIRSHLCILRNFIRSPALFPEENLPLWAPVESESKDDDSDMRPNLTRFRYATGFPEPLPAAAGRRAELFEVVHAAIAHMLATREDDIKALTTLAKIAEVMLCFRGFRSSLRNAFNREYATLRAVQSHPYNSQLYTESSFFTRLLMQHGSRQDMVARLAPLHEHHMTLICDLYSLSTAHYPKLRAKAQALLRHSLVIYTPARHFILKRAITDLRRATVLSPPLSSTPQTNVDATSTAAPPPSSVDSTVRPMDVTTESSAAGPDISSATSEAIMSSLKKESEEKKKVTDIVTSTNGESGPPPLSSDPMEVDGAEESLDVTTVTNTEPLSRSALKGVLHVLTFDVLVRYHNLNLLKSLCVAVAGLSSQSDKKIQNLVRELSKAVTQALFFKFDFSLSSFDAPLFEALVALYPPAEAHRSFYMNQSPEYWTRREQRRSKQHNNLIETLLDLCRTLHAHWFYELIMAVVLNRVAFHDQRDSILEYFMQSITNVRLAQVSMDHVLVMLRQFKVNVPRTVTHPPTRQPVSPAAGFFLNTGVRPDNHDLIYHVGVVLSESELANIAFADHLSDGWSPILEWSAYEPSSRRTTAPINNAYATTILNVLTPEWLSELIVREGASLGTTASFTFNERMSKLYTKLFRLGPLVFDRLKPQIELLTGPGSTPPQHRCASEMVAGLMRGSRHWLIEDSEAMWGWLMPYLVRAWGLMTSETRQAWIACLQKGLLHLDPRRYTRLAKLILDQVLESITDPAIWAASLKNLSSPAESSQVSSLSEGASEVASGPGAVPTNVTESSTGAALPTEKANAEVTIVSETEKVECEGMASGAAAAATTRLDAPSVLAMRLRLLHSILARLSWKGSELASLLLEVLPRHIGQEYKLVRVAISDLLYSSTRCLMTTPGSHVASGIEHDRTLTKFLTGVADSLTVSSLVNVSPAAINLMKTNLGFLASHFRTYDLHQPHLALKLIQLLLVFPTETSTDPDLPPLLTAALTSAKHIEFRDHFPALFDTCISCAKSATWHAKMRIVSFCQVSLFNNLFFVPKARILDLFQPLLTDEHVEVRNGASASLSGLVRCGLVDAEQFATLLATWAGPPLKAKRGLVANMSPEERLSLIQRHAGVLGLRALIEAFPYSVPTWMPDVLVKFCLHVSDVDPIGSTVRAGMSEFWRTHREGWERTKMLFNEAQLDAVTNTLISPWYFA